MRFYLTRLDTPENVYQNYVLREKYQQAHLITLITRANQLRNLIIKADKDPDGWKAWRSSAVLHGEPRKNAKPGECEYVRTIVEIDSILYDYVSGHPDYDSEIPENCESQFDDINHYILLTRFAFELADTLISDDDETAQLIGNALKERAEHWKKDLCGGNLELITAE